MPDTLVAPPKLVPVLEHLGAGDGAEINVKDFARTGIHFEIVLPEARLRELGRFLLSQEFFLESLSAVDFLDCFELDYHFNHWSEALRFVIKVVIPKTQEQATTIHDIYRCANWFEREIYDMFGLKFKDHPNLKRLLLPESSTIHPLLKSFKGEPDGSDVEHVKKLIQEDKEGFEITYPETLPQHKDEYTINFGPQHPSTHGVLRILLRTKGERVLSCEPVIGYSHRNQEKMAEIQEYRGFWPNTGRLDYVGAMSYNLGYAVLIEKATALTPPPRTQYIRVLLTEFNRIASHLLWMATYLLDLGAFTPFFYCFDDRERILDMLEHVTGERLTYDYFRFGGLDHDMNDDTVIPMIRAFIPHFQKRLKDYEKLVAKNVIFIKRTEGVGIITKEMALSHGVTGPCLRASGVRLDERRHEPYSIYPELDFEIPMETAGDAFARYLIRTREMAESLKIVRQIYEKIPKGEINAGKPPRSVPKGETYAAVEAARGSFGMYLVSDGSIQPYRLKLRSPSYSNLSSLVDILRNCFVADVVAILGSIDVVMPEIDR